MSLCQLNEVLSDRSYIRSCVPCNVDYQTLQTIKQQPSAEYPNVLRWYNHMKSFSEQEKKNFPTVAQLFKVYEDKLGEVKNDQKAAAGDGGDDDDVDLFGSDDDNDAEAEKLKEERLKAYAAKKSKKPAVVAKSSIILDVKPWDDETDMKTLEEQVRTINMPGLLWGASKLVPVGYGIKKLQIMCVVEDEKVSVDDLVEKIQEFEDYVQSVDIAAFNKI